MMKAKYPELMLNIMSQFNPFQKNSKVKGKLQVKTRDQILVLEF